MLEEEIDFFAKWSKNLEWNVKLVRKHIFRYFGTTLVNFENVEFETIYTILHSRSKGQPLLRQDSVLCIWSSSVSSPCYPELEGNLGSFFKAYSDNDHSGAEMAF